MSNKYLLIGIIVVAIAAIVSIGFASGTFGTNIEVCNDCIISGSESETAGVYGRSDSLDREEDIASDFDHGIYIGSDGYMENDGYSYDGFIDSGTLTVSTSSGGLLSIQNTTGIDLLCDQAVYDITTGPDGSSMDFSMGTSTTALPTGDPGLIATTTVATSSVDILSKEDDEGTDTRDIWNWDNDVYIVGSMDQESGTTASSTDYDTVVGKYYVNCWAK